MSQVYVVGVTCGAFWLTFTEYLMLAQLAWRQSLAMARRVIWFVGWQHELRKTPLLWQW